MKLSLILLPALLSGLALSGCSCDEPIAEGEGEGEVDLDDAVELCTVYTRGQSTFLGSLFGGGGFARCSATDVIPEFPAAEIAEIRAGCADPANPVTQEFQTALTGGRVTMNVANVQACADFIPAGEAAPPAACDALFVSLVGAGEPCEQAWDCEGELLCEATDIVRQVFTCTAPAALNEPCLPQTDIVAPSARTCDADLECTNFVCVEPAPPGPAPVVGDTCADASECGDTLRCDLTLPPVGADPADELGTCQARSLVGGVCASGDDCELLPDADGNPTTACGPAGTCVVTKNDGASCDAAADVCSAGCSVCRPSIPGAGAAACQDRGAAGDACRSTVDCRHSFVCDEATNVCVSGSAVGGPCDDFEECRDDSLDCGAAGTCVTVPGLGEACGEDTTTFCLEGACVDGQCRAGDAGDPCTTDDECTGDNLCVGDTCAAAPQSGACSIDDGCAPGFVCDAASTCQPVPGVGDNCTELDCDFGTFCGADSVCAVQAEAGGQCTTDDQCLSGTCVRLVCGAQAVGCTSDKGFFQTFVLLAVIVPLRWRRRRH
jgi:hypothetical protein